MRFWLILVAVLSGLSLGSGAHAASAADVVGVAECASVVAAPVSGPCAVRQQIARARLKVDMVRKPWPTEAGIAFAAGITVLDRPLE